MKEETILVKRTIEKDGLPEKDKQVFCLHESSENKFVSYRTNDCNTGIEKWQDGAMPDFWYEELPLSSITEELEREVERLEEEDKSLMKVIGQKEIEIIEMINRVADKNTIILSKDRQILQQKTAKEEWKLIAEERMEVINGLREDVIGFPEWKDSEGFTKISYSDDDNNGKWYDEFSEGINRHYLTIEQLYAKYLSTKAK